MSDFPAYPGAKPFGVLSSVDPSCSQIGEYLLSTNTGSSTGAVWPTANMAFYIPVIVEAPCTAYMMAIMVTTQAGNVDVGIYNETGTRLVSAGSTATAAAGIQTFDITDTPLGPGIYYLAMACSSTSAAFFRASPNGNIHRTCGLASQTSALALPSTATFATGQTYVPVVQATTKATV